jgi:ribosomal protein L11 methyltransferase
LSEQGILLLSGFYISDFNIISGSALNFSLKPDKKVEKNDWVAARFIKSRETV